MNKFGFFSFTIWLLLNLTVGTFLTITLVGLVKADDGFTLTVNTIGNGNVTKNPDKDGYFFETVWLTAVADLGWSFSGWSGDLRGSDNPDYVRMNRDKNVTATFTQNEYTLTINRVGSGSVDKNPNQATYYYGDNVSLTATPAEGWMFSGWSGDLSGVDELQSIIMDGDKTLEATFIEIPMYDLKIAVIGSGTTIPSEGVHSYTKGSEVKVEATPDSGWILDHWILDTIDVGSADYINVTMNANHNLTAVFRDITPPTIEIISPDNITYSTTDVELIFTVNEGASWIGYSLNGAENTSISGNVTLIDLSEGSHSIVVFANDTTGNTGESNVVHFSVDTTPPTITIHSPISSTYSSSAISLRFSVSEETSWIGYMLDGQNNITISGNTTISGLSDGSHNLVVYANDTVDNMGKSATIYFVVYIPPVDTTPPTITIISPQETTYEVSEVSLYFSVNEDTSWIGYSLDGQDNVTITGDTVLSGLSDGSHTIVVFATDYAGNTGASDTVQFTISTPPVDTTPPTITIISPQETTYSTPEIALNFNIDELVSWIAYSLDGEDNVTITENTVLSGLSEEEHTIKIFARDQAGNTGASNKVTFRVDTTPPTVTLTSPEETTYSTTNVFLEITLNEEATWIGYSLDGEDNVTITGDSNLSGLSDGSHTIVVFATDYAGNTGASDTVQFTISTPPVDTTPPTIIINSPENITYEVSEVSLYFSVNEDTSWIGYSLDGQTNTSLSGNVTLIDLSEGSHSIVVFANDTTGNSGASDVVQFVVSTSPVDTTPPTIIINSPENITYNTNTISLEFTVNEEPSIKIYSLHRNF